MKNIVYGDMLNFQNNQTSIAMMNSLQIDDIQAVIRLVCTVYQQNI